MYIGGPAEVLLSVAVFLLPAGGWSNGPVSVMGNVQPTGL